MAFVELSFLVCSLDKGRVLAEKKSLLDNRQHLSRDYVRTFAHD